MKRALAGAVVAAAISIALSIPLALAQPASAPIDKALRAAVERGDEGIYDRFVGARQFHDEWLAGRSADEPSPISTADLKPSSLFFPSKLGELLRRGDKK